MCHIKEVIYTLTQALFSPMECSTNHERYKKILKQYENHVTKSYVLCRRRLFPQEMFKKSWTSKKTTTKLRVKSVIYTLPLALFSTRNEENARTLWELLENHRNSHNKWHLFLPQALVSRRNNENILKTMIVLQKTLKQTDKSRLTPDESWLIPTKPRWRK